MNKNVNHSTSSQLLDFFPMGHTTVKSRLESQTDDYVVFPRRRALLYLKQALDPDVYAINKKGPMVLAIAR